MPPCFLLPCYYYWYYIEIIALDTNSAIRYHFIYMIKTFKDKETEKIFKLQFSRKLPNSIQQGAVRKLSYLHAAKELKDLTILPANKLEKLSGNRKGQYSMRINDQWRICFKWRSSNVYDVEIVDYH